MELLLILFLVVWLVFVVTGFVRPEVYKDHKTGDVPSKKTIIGAALATLAIPLMLYSEFSGEDPEPTAAIVVTQAEYGDSWPLIENQAILDCELPDVAFVVVDDKMYALNGGGLRAGYPRPDAIRKNPDQVMLADFVERAINICYQKR